MKRRMLIPATVVIMMLLVSGVLAQSDGEPTPAPIEPMAPGLLAPDFVPPVPPVFGGMTISPGSLGDTAIDDVAAPLEACDTAAGSYMQPGMEAIRNTIISFDDIVYGNEQEESALYALYAIEDTQLFDSRNRFAAANNLIPVGPFNDGDIVTIGTANICVSTSLLTVRLWELTNGEWVIDTISVNEPLDITNSWPDNTPDPQNPGQSLAGPQFPVLVDGLVFRYLMPYLEPPLTTMPGANQVDSDLPTANACAHAAPSYLTVGMPVILNGYGYEQMPDLSSDPDWTTWTFHDTHFALSDHGMATYIDVLNSTPLLNIPGNFEAVALPSADLLANGTTFTTGQIINGPFCTETTVAPPEMQSCACTTLPCQPCTTGSGNPDPNRFYTWWEVEVTVNGQTHYGFYPENVGQYSHWLWATDGIFPRKLFLYYMVPDALAMQTQPATQIQVAPPVSQLTQVPPTLVPIEILPTQVPATLTVRPTQAPPTSMPMITPIQVQPTPTTRPIQVVPIIPTMTPTPGR